MGTSLEKHHRRRIWQFGDVIVLLLWCYGKKVIYNQILSVIYSRILFQYICSPKDWVVCHTNVPFFQLLNTSRCRYREIKADILIHHLFHLKVKCFRCKQNREICCPNTFGGPMGLTFTLRDMLTTLTSILPVLQTNVNLINKTIRTFSNLQTEIRNKEHGFDGCT